MALHRLEPTRETLHGCFSRDLPPVLTVDSGDTVELRTIDAGWGLEPYREPLGKRRSFAPRRRSLDHGHALCGPIAVRGARAGHVLEVRIDEIVPGEWGWTHAAGWPGWLNKRLGLVQPPQHAIIWTLDTAAGTARNHLGDVIALHPFLGVMGVAPAEPGVHSTFPPRATGGNLDCRDLTAGATLFLPIAVDGALLSVGDGHAAQGDGEVSGQAIECPMERVRLTLVLRDDFTLTAPRAETAEGSITFGLHKDLNEAMALALEAMLDLLVERYGWERKHALGMASLVVNFRVTQVVNGTRGVHALLPRGAVQNGR